MTTDMQQVYQQFMAGAPRPTRSRLFRLRYWILAKLFGVGEWAGRKLSRGLTPLEQIYMACDLDGTTPEHLRKKLEIAQSAFLDILAKSASVKAARSGIVQ